MIGRLFSRLAAPPFVYHDAYSCPWPETHRFPMAKFRLLKETLLSSQIFNGDFRCPPHPLESTQVMDAVYLAHDRRYIERFCNGELSTEERRKVGLDFNDHLVYRTFAEIGGTLHASELALEYGMALNGAGGTHHAHFEHGSGFTIINDLAVTAKSLLHRGLCKSILIFDCDVHQGDGTASICAGDDRIFTVSIHCEQNFPFMKAKSMMDIGLEAGIQDAAYMEALRTAFHTAVASSRPDFVLYDAGVDISEFDLLGKMKISDKGIYERDFFVLDSCRRLGIPVCGVIGGGYDANIRRLVARHSLLYRAAINSWNTVVDRGG